MLQLQCFVDDLMYGHNDNRSKEENKKDIIKYHTDDFLSFIFLKYKKRLPQQYQQKTCREFFGLMAKLRKSRYVCGVLLRNEDKDLLCIVDSTGKINLPKGKENYDDRKDKRTTAFRELGEEGGVKLSKNDIEKHNDWIEIEHKRSAIRLYKVTEFPKSEVDLSHFRIGEVKELCWLPQSEFRNNEYKGMKLSVILKKALEHL